MKRKSPSRLNPSAQAFVAAELARQFKLQEKFFDIKLRKACDNVVQQLEAYLALQAVMAGGLGLPKLHGWPLSADLALYLARLVQAGGFDAVIEFGSGASTLVLAQTAKAHQAPGAAPALHLCFEHLPAYHQQTADLLAQHGLRERVQLELAPLQPFPDAEGAHLFYHCQPALQALAAQLAERGLQQPRLLVLVDGPPGNTNPQARWPAFPAVAAVFGQARLDVLADDTVRKDEKDAVARWLAQAAEQQWEASEERLPFEKGASHLRFRLG